MTYSCCCCQSEVRSPSPTLPGKWNEAADPNLNPMQAVETESIGNSRVGKGGKKKKAKKYEATVMPVLLDYMYLCPFVFRLDLILPAISQPILQRLQRVRCALRALMMPISLSYPFTVPPWARHRDSRGYFCIQCADSDPPSGVRKEQPKKVGNCLPTHGT